MNKNSQAHFLPRPEFLGVSLLVSPPDQGRWALLWFEFSSLPPPSFSPSIGPDPYPST